MQDSGVFLIIVLTFFGFLLLAFILLFPVSRFLDREKKEAEHWTDEAIARQQQHDKPMENGISEEDDDDRR